jgi:hypothetical protein
MSASLSADVLATSKKPVTARGHFSQIALQGSKNLRNVLTCTPRNYTEPGVAFKQTCLLLELRMLLAVYAHFVFNIGYVSAMESQETIILKICSRFTIRLFRRHRNEEAYIATQAVAKLCTASR